MAAVAVVADDLTHADWRAGLPMLRGERLVLRELEVADAAPLLRIAQRPEVSRYSWPAPSSLEEFARFVQWARKERFAGKYIGFAVVPKGEAAAAGLFELRQMQPRFFRAELGFFVDRSLWGHGIFHEAARLLIHFATETVHVRRIEARVAVDNVRSNEALRRLGAMHEGLLHAAFVRGTDAVDQNLWSVVPPER